MINTKVIPKEPGVYFFKDSKNKIIYVGKAKNLKNRVSSYFSTANHSAKTIALVQNIASIDYIIVDSEFEALLLENKLIKQHDPKYNIHLKDAKTYAYILLTNEEFPRIVSTRKTNKKGNYFGPYTSGSARNELIHLAIKLFKLRVCKNLPTKACLNYHIGLCTAPCIKKIDGSNYQLQVKEAINFLKGNTAQIVQELKEEMQQASSAHKFEIALEKKRQIEAIHHLNQKQKVDILKNFDQDVVAIKTIGGKSVIELFSIKKGVISGKKEFRFDAKEDLFAEFIKLYYSTQLIPKEIIVNAKFWADDLEKNALEKYFSSLRGAVVNLIYPKQGEKQALIALAEKNALAQIENVALKELQEKLSLKELPEIIECFDISNLGSQFIVAAMTQWINGAPNKQGYRKFKIKTVYGKNDDFASIKEVILRRYSRLIKENAIFPNLIIIDGGKGQLNAALESLKFLRLQIPIIALAKEHEEIYLEESSTPICFDSKTQMMILLRQIRDSVHSFALSYNHKLREMQFKEEIK